MDTPLVQWAVERAGVSREHVEAARLLARAKGRPLADVLVANGLLSFEQIPDELLDSPTKSPARVTQIAADRPAAPPPEPVQRGDSIIADTQHGRDPTRTRLGPNATAILDRLPSMPGGPAPALPGSASVSQDPTFTPVGLAGVTPSQGPRKFGKFLLLEELGSGGMGTVYRAFQTDLEREVALKVLHGAAAAGATLVERFRREARAAAKLEHPGIVRVYEVGCEDGTDFFTMEFVQGRNLSEAIAANPPIQERVRWLRDAAQALQHAHERGLIHRDLKPQNLLVDSWGHVKVADFGLAREISAGKGLTLSGQAIGTPHYMSPEQAAGEWDRVGTASDIYSLGATLYEVLAGVPPVPGKEVYEVMQGVVDGRQVPLRKSAPQVPRDLETIVMKALDLEPPRRYATMRDFAEDLDRFLRFEAIQARPLSFWGRRVRDMKRHGRAVAATSAALVLAGAAIAWGWGRLSDLEAAKRAEQEAATREREQAAAARQAHDLLMQAMNPDVVLPAGGTREQVRLLNDALRLHPEFAEAHFRLAVIHEQTGEFADAARHYQEAIRLDATSVRPRAVCALFLLHHDVFAPTESRKFTLGERMLAELEQEAPAEPYTKLVRLFREALFADKAGAARIVRELDSLGESVPESRLLLAGMLGYYRHPVRETVLGRLARDLDRSLAELQGILGREPLNVLAHMDLGVLAIELGDYALAQRELSFAARNAPTWGEPPFFLGRLAYLQGRAEDALALFEQAIERERRAEWVHFKAIVLCTQRRFDDADAALRKLFPAGMEPADHLFLRGLVRFAGGHDAEGKADLARFAESQREWADRLRQMGAELQKPIGAMLAGAIRNDLLHFPDLLFLAPGEKATVRGTFKTVLALPQVREVVTRYREGTEMRREVEEFVFQFSQIEREVPELQHAWAQVMQSLGVSADPKLLLSIATFGMKLTRDAELRERGKLHSVDDLLWRAGARYRTGKYDAARADLVEALRLDGACAKAHYAMATLWAIEGKARECADALRSARQYGWANLHFVQEDPDFAKVRLSPEVQEVLKRGK